MGKNNLSKLLYDFCKGIYHRTFFYRKKIKRIKEKEYKKQQTEKLKEQDIIKSVFNNQYIIHNGPFKGMKYIKTSSCSALLPKILGSYEEPIQNWIEEDIINTQKYDYILDIGCAEGYYACGFAKNLPNTKIIAYDIDNEAIKNIKELARINEINNIEIKSECTHKELNIKSRPNTLIFCDIEGSEKFLLDPLKVPNLKYVDLIVESHDWIVPNMIDILIKRFYFTHKIKVVVDYPFRTKKYFTPNICNNSTLRYIIDERRPLYMKFLYIKHLDEKI